MRKETAQKIVGKFERKFEGKHQISAVIKEAGRGNILELLNAYEVLDAGKNHVEYAWDE